MLLQSVLLLPCYCKQFYYFHVTANRFITSMLLQSVLLLPCYCNQFYYFHVTAISFITSMLLQSVPVDDENKKDTVKENRDLS